MFQSALKLLKDLEDVLDLVEDGLGLGKFQPTSPNVEIDATNPGGGDGSNNEDSESLDDDELFASYAVKSPLQVGLTRLESIIDRLYRLSFKIRNPATRIGFSKASAYRLVDKDTKVDLIDQYALHDQRYVEEESKRMTGLDYKDLESNFLVQRLA